MFSAVTTEVASAGSHEAHVAVHLAAVAALPDFLQVPDWLK
jgi:hypothetical protein